MGKQFFGKLILVGFVLGAVIAPYGSAFAQSGEVLTKAECFEFLKPFTVSTEISPELATGLAGAQMRFFVTAKNQNTFPIIDGAIYVKVFKKQTVAKSAQENGEDLVDQFFAKEGLNLKAMESRKMDFLWTVPARAPQGDYIIRTYFVSGGKKFDLDGVSYSDSVSSGRTSFKVQSSMKASVALDRNNVKLNNVKTSPLGEKTFKKDGAVVFSAPLSNPTAEAQEVKVTYELYKWSNLLSSQRIDTKEETIVLKAKETKTLTYEAKDASYPVYYLVVKAQWKSFSSIVNVRFLREGVDALRLNLVGIGGFPIKDVEGNSVFVCAQNVGTKSAVAGKLELSLWDKSDKSIKKYDYSGDFDNFSMGLRTGFAVPKGFENFRVKAVLYDAEGKQVDEAELKYNCSEIDPTLCKQEPVTPATKPPMDTKTLMLYGGIAGAIVIIAIVILIVLKRRKSGPPPMSGPSSPTPMEPINYGNQGDSTHVEVGQTQ